MYQELGGELVHPEYRYLELKSTKVCLFVFFKEEYFITAAAAAAKSFLSCPTLCNLIDGSPPASPIPGILQARTLEWVVISFSNA